MKIENQVTSLETSKELKELGLDSQITSFYWCEFAVGSWQLVFVEDYENDFVPQTGGAWNRIPAFTASELAEMLPRNIIGKKSRYNLQIDLDNKANWEVSHYSYKEDDTCGGIHENKSLVEALAACLIHLKENRLI